MAFHLCIWQIVKKKKKVGVETCTFTVLSQRTQKDDSDGVERRISLKPAVAYRPIIRYRNDSISQVSYLRALGDHLE